MRRFVAIMLVFSLALSVSVSATSIQADSSASFLKSAIIASIQVQVNDPYLEIFDDISLLDLKVGSPLNVYEYVPTGFEKIHEYIPLYVEQELVLLSVSVDGIHYQFFDTLAQAVCEYLASAERAALIYDKQSLYVFDGTTFHLVQEFVTETPYRCALPEKIMQTEMQTLSTTDVLSMETLGYYENTNQARANAYYSCSVDYVSQGNNDYLCGAATIACILNSISEYHDCPLPNGPLTTASVAQTCLGNPNATQGINTASMQVFLDDYFETPGESDYYDFYITHDPLSDGTIVTNLRNGYPICVQAAPEMGYWHWLTLYAINLTSGYVTFMNPMPLSEGGGACTGYLVQKTSSNDAEDAFEDLDIDRSSTYCYVTYLGETSYWYKSLSTL